MAYNVTYRSGTVSTNVAGPGNIAMESTFGRDADMLLSGTARIHHRLSIMLGAHSVLTISGEYFRSAVLGDPDDAAFATRSIDVLYIDSGNTSWVKQRDFLPTVPGEPVNEAFWYSVANTSDVGRAVSVRFLIENRLDVLTPVPEPSTYAMLLAGLGALAASARRHR